MPKSGAQSKFPAIIHSPIHIESGIIPRIRRWPHTTTVTADGYAQHMGDTVTYALQLAFHMGFKQVILIGVDHHFTTQGKPNTTIESKGEDPDHFAGNYFGKGFRWQLPDLETSERSYRMAGQAFAEAGREVLDNLAANWRIS
jgi:hypothetical protein